MHFENDPIIDKLVVRRRKRKKEEEKESIDHYSLIDRAQTAIKRYTRARAHT